MRGAAEGNGAGGLEEETHTQIQPMNLEARQPVHVTTPMNLEVRQLHVTCPCDHPRFNGRVNVPIGSDGREMTR